jgi:hypothetical protein
MPVIRADGDNVTFFFAVAIAQVSAHLVIRCDGDGEVWASINPEPQPGRSKP